MVPRAAAAPLRSVMIRLAFAASGIAAVASVSVAGGSVKKASVASAEASKTPAGATLMRRESLAVDSSGTVDIDSDVAVLKSQATGSGASVPLSLADGGKAGRGEEVDGSSRADEESPEGGDLDEEDDEDKEFALRHGLHVPVRPSSLIVIDGHQDDARPIERVVAAAALAETESVSCGGARRAQHCGACLTSRETGLPASTWCRGECYLTYGGEEDQQCAPITTSIVGSLKGGGDDLSRSAALVALSPEGDLEKAESEVAKQNKANVATRNMLVLDSLALGGASTEEQDDARAKALQKSIELHRGQHVVKSALNASYPVWCGGHSAYGCSACSAGHGHTWCNGDCEWMSGTCGFRSDLVWCGKHSAATCYFCTVASYSNQKDGPNYQACGGDSQADCEWHYPGYCKKRTKAAETGWDKPI